MHTPSNHNVTTVILPFNSHTNAIQSDGLLHFVTWYNEEATRQVGSYSVNFFC